MGIENAQLPLEPTDKARVAGESNVITGSRVSFERFLRDDNTDHSRTLIGPCGTVVQSPSGKNDHIRCATRYQDSRIAWQLPLNQFTKMGAEVFHWNYCQITNIPATEASRTPLFVDRRDADHELCPLDQAKKSARFIGRVEGDDLLAVQRGIDVVHQSLSPINFPAFRRYPPRPAGQMTHAA